MFEKENGMELLTSRLSKGKIIVIGGRPAMGKTALALSIVAESKLNFFALTLEGNNRSYEKKLASIILKKQYLKSDYEQSNDDYEEIKKDGVYRQICNDHTITIKELYDELENDLLSEVLIIDYIQLFRDDFANDVSPDLRIGYIMRELRKMANELGICIIVISQLSRLVEQRTGHRPMLTDLKDSGSLEADSDEVWMLLRRDYYDPYDKPGMAEITIAKDREKSIGHWDSRIDLIFDKEYGGFINYSAVSNDDTDCDLSF